jgi:hypothetical protein
MSPHPWKVVSARAKQSHLQLTLCRCYSPCLIAPDGLTILSISSMKTMPSCSATRSCKFYTSRQAGRQAGRQGDSVVHAYSRCMPRYYTLSTPGAEASSISPSMTMMPSCSATCSCRHARIARTRRAGRYVQDTGKEACQGTGTCVPPRLASACPHEGLEIHPYPLAYPTDLLLTASLASAAEHLLGQCILMQQKCPTSAAFSGYSSSARHCWPQVPQVCFSLTPSPTTPPSQQLRPSLQHPYRLCCQCVLWQQCPCLHLLKVRQISNPSPVQRSQLSL